MQYFEAYMTPKRYFITIFHCLFITLTLLFCVPDAFSQNAKFTVVIDAGHGGHDPGAIGTFAKEKDINLAISLRVANLIENNFPDVKVVLTRKTDIFLPLQERADIVNANNANLFLCIHTNSSESASAYGAETFTLGLAKSKSNLDVAMRENSVILLEKDYQTRYKGFDPNSVDSYIMFEFMQDKYIDRSIEIAQDIQKQFVNYSKRFDRGVRQAGFWVLHRSACPSVLIEVGFVSNPSEERYLASDNGRQEMATSIYNAFVKFKKEHDKKSGKFTSDDKYEMITKKSAVDNNLPNDSDKTKTTVPVKNTQTTNVIDSAFGNTVKKDNLPTDNKTNNKPAIQSPVFKVQILASEKKLNIGASQLKGLKDFDSFVENKMYKYTVGAETDYKKIAELRKEIAKKFPEAFIIAFVGEKKISANEALKLIKK